jgi:hypothetical protein
MKKYKNVWLSLGFYVLAFLLTYVIQRLGNSTALVPFFVLIILGIFFALRSNASKESSWAGGVMIFIGVLILATPSILSSYSFWGFLYNLGIR